MKTLHGIPVFLLALTITILQFDHCYGREWHRGFNRYPTSDGTVEYFMNSIDKPVKKSSLEQILIYLRDTFSKGRNQEIPESIRRELGKFTIKLRNAARKLKDQNERSGRVLHRWVNTLSSYLSDIGEYVVGDVEYTADLISDAISPSYEMMHEYTESLAVTLHNLAVQLGTIVPGTLWCGAGNVADANDEVGLFDKVDSCCSAHDLCSFNIGATGELPEHLQQELAKFSTVINDAAVRYQQGRKRNGRFFNLWEDVVGPLASATGEYVVADFEYVGEQIDDYFNTWAEVVDEHAESFHETLKKMAIQLHTIVPGTLWCGAGNVADANDEVGLFDKMDSCCSAHDLCSFNIGAGKKFGPLVNDGLFTKSACYCDREFYECLKRANDLVSIKVGITYFTLLSPQCIGRDHLKVGCRSWENDLETKCITPYVNATTYKHLQWFSSPDF